MRARTPTAALAALGASLAGCGAADEPPDVTRVALVAVPDGVACLRFSVRPAGAPEVVVDRDVGPSAEAVVSLGALPGGATIISAGAFPAACRDVTATSVPAWVAGPQTFSLRAGYRNEVELTFRPNAGASVGGSFVAPVRAIALGARTAYALGEDGVVRAWGLNDQGQLGAGSVGAPARRPVALALRDVAEVAAGSSHACARTADGAVWCWGANANGQLGTGDATPRAAPAAVASAVRFVQLDAGARHTCGVSTGGAVGCWGRRASFGPAGADALAPAFSVFGGGVLGVSVGGDATCVRLPDARIRCAGANATGELGNGVFGPATEYAATLFPLAAAHDIGARHACVVALSGALLCAGSASHGQLGNGTRGNYFEKVPVTASFTGAAAVAAGGRFTCALRGDATVWCWGAGALGQVGAIAAAGATASLPPRQVAGLTDVTQVAAGEEFACALRRDGSAWCWGSNDAGQLGDGTVAVRYTPVRVNF